MDHRDYQARLGDTKAATAPYLSHHTEGDEAWAPMAAALNFYTVAGIFLRRPITYSTPPVGSSAAYLQSLNCPGLNDVTERDIVVKPILWLWSCAADKIAEAEKLLTPSR